MSDIYIYIYIYTYVITPLHPYPYSLEDFNKYLHLSITNIITI